MAARKKSENSLAAPLSRAAGVLQLISSEIALGAALLVLLLVGGFYGWKKWGVPVTQQAEYRLTAASIEIPPPPPWIRADVKAEAFRDGSLETLSMFDAGLSLRIYQAFQMHAWVEQVNQVTKRAPNRVRVDLAYRRPVAWVEVPAGVLPNNEVGLLPVDKAGVLLPTADFTAEHVDDYPRIAVAELTPCGLPGAAWGDPRVAAAAEIAALLQDDAELLGLHRIIATMDATDPNSAGHVLYRVTTRKGLRFVWGNPPHRERPNEPTAAQKKSLLRQIAEALAKNGGQAVGQEIDLRNPDAALSASRTASRSTESAR